LVCRAVDGTNEIGAITIEDVVSVEGAVRSAEGAEPIMNLLLTDEERQRFADWLEMSADSNEQIAAQMERVGSPPMMAVAKLNRTEAAAMRVVLRKLRTTESMSIKP
jgi:hypothetical protein